MKIQLVESSMSRLRPGWPRARMELCHVSLDTKSEVVLLVNHKNENRWNKIRIWNRHAHYAQNLIYLRIYLTSRDRKESDISRLVSPKHIVSTNCIIQRISRLHQARLSIFKCRLVYAKLLWKRRFAHSEVLLWEGSVIRHQGVFRWLGNNWKWIMSNSMCVKHDPALRSH